MSNEAIRLTTKVRGLSGYNKVTNPNNGPAEDLRERQAGGEIPG